MRVKPFALIAAASVVVLALIISAALQAQRSRMERELMAPAPNDVAQNRALLRFAATEGRPLFAAHCAVCHGADMKGLPNTGAPNLTDQSWLYGDGDLFSIERTILYGVRSPEQKSRNVTEMPAFGLRGQLSDVEIKNLVQYILSLNGRPNDPEAAEAGQTVFQGATYCGDCHGPDARGNSDYGAPDLTDGVWLYGGDPASLYKSIYYGRHGVMPAWIGKLTLPQIRELAAYVYVASHPASAH